MLYLGNAFSISMLSSILDSEKETNIKVKEVDLETAKEIIRNANEFTSAVGHPSTADVMTQMLGTEVKPNRIQLQLKHGDQLLILQILVRLEEGRVLNADEILALPVKWYLVELS
jgi:hypothetical protein